MNKLPKEPPKPKKVVRKLTLSKEMVAQLGEAPGPVACTRKATGCPIHTC